MTDDSMMAETSLEGARRMRQLRQANLTCGPSPHAFIDPITSSLAYLAPASSQYRGHLITTLASTIPPRQLPSGQPGFPSRDISISPDGKWVTVFHPHAGQVGGVLAMYTSSVLSPVAVSGKIVPISTFNLSHAPLAIEHNHSPRLYTARGRGPAIGPRSFGQEEEAHGPSITVVCADGIYLFHPFQIIDTSLGSMPVNGSANSQSTWRMQMLKCPLHTRFRAVMGGQLAEDTGLRAKRAWIGTVMNSEAIWVGIEVAAETRVIRVEYEVDDAGRFSMTTVPLPSLPSNTSPSLTDGSASYIRPAEMQGLMFVSLSNPTVDGANASGNLEMKPRSFSDERIGAIQILRESSGEKDSYRTVLQACRIENTEFELAEGFKELGNDHSDGAVSSDWVTLSRSPSTSTSPEGWTILALHPLPSLSPPSLALALLLTSNGLMLSHIDLMDSTSPSTTEEGNWTALRGSPVHIREDVGSTDISLSLTQGVLRGESGLIAIISKVFGAILSLGPKLNAANAQDNGDNTVQDSKVEDAASSITLAMEQGQNYADAVRACLSSASQNERDGLGEQVIQQCHQRLQDNVNLDELRQLLGLQTTIFSTLDDPRHATASELVRLLEACYLFMRCATKGPGKTIAFDLASVWPLINVADWVGGILAQIMRSVIAARGQLEWFDGDLPASVPFRILYLVHPTLRSLITRLHSQLNAFTQFVLSIDRPIAHPKADPLSPMMDPRATILAKANVVDVLGKEGVDLVEWGRAIEALPPSTVSNADITDALLKLSCHPIRSAIPEILSSLPTPSALLRSTSRFAEHGHDGITFESLPHGAARLARCDRCGWKTSAIGDQGWLGLGIWGQWRQEQERLCVCGGAWIRESKRAA